MTIEQAAYDVFVKDFMETDRYKYQRFGQAFFSAFGLHRMKHQPFMDTLYEARYREDAERIIKRHFNIQ
jgi:hypothetical protein